MKRGANEKYHLFPVYWTENLKGLFYFSKIDVKLFIQVHLDGIIESIRNI